MEVTRLKITAYFSGIKEANQTVEALRDAGFTDALADINDEQTDLNRETNQPGTETSSNSLADLVLKSGDHAVDREKAPLMAASPMVSGMGNFDEIYSPRFRVMAEVPESQRDTFREIIRKMGGDLDNPHVDMPQGLENVGLEDVFFSDLDEV